MLRESQMLKVMMFQIPQPQALSSCTIELLKTHTHTNVSSHMNDLHDISKRHPEMIKPIVALLLDGGNDWTPKSNINQMYMG